MKFNLILKAILSAWNKVGIRFIWSLSILLCIITFILVLIQTKNGPLQVALHYNVITGVDTLGPYYFLYILPGSTLIIILLNLILVRFIPQHKEFFGPMLAGVTLMCAAISLLATSLLIWLNY